MPKGRGQYPVINKIEVKIDYEFLSFCSGKNTLTWKEKRKLRAKKRAVEKGINRLKHLLSIVDKIENKCIDK